MLIHLLQITLRQDRLELPRGLQLVLEQLLLPVRMLVLPFMVLDLLLRLQGDFQDLLVRHHRRLHLTNCLMLHYLRLHPEVKIDPLIQEQVLVLEPDLLMLVLVKL